MDFLEAIQKIPGHSAKEKYQAQRLIIKQVIETKKAPGDFSSQTSPEFSIPEKLTPLIATEVAKILKNADDIILALKSEDLTIVNRALQAEWFFDGSNKTVTNFPYFAAHIFPEVSLNTRNKIIKSLSQQLSSKKEYDLAQEFFEGLLKFLDFKNAIPLLNACSENYILQFVEDKKVLLPKKMVTRIFPKYPELVIKYLKSREYKSNALKNHKAILPRIIKNYVNDFIDIIKMIYCDLKLGNKLSELFLKGEGAEAIIKYPRRFLKLVPLKLVTKRLSKEQFEVMFRNLFPEKQFDFSFDYMLTYLEFQPEESKLPLIRKIFKELYGMDLISVLDKVTIQMMLMLPEEDRINVAKKKLAEDSDSNIYCCERSWVCYLSTGDSIPRLKDQISKSIELSERKALIVQLIYTCKVNKSKEDLLLVLQHISTEHQGEVAEFWFLLYDALLKYFDLALLSPDHWTILNKMIERSSVNNGLLKNVYTSKKLLLEAVHYNLLHNISIEDPMTLLIEVYIKSGISDFDLFSDYPTYEKKCWERFLDIISKKFLEDYYKICSGRREHYLTERLLKGLYGYNAKMIKAANKKQEVVKSEELFSLSNYSWLLETVESIVVKKVKKSHYVESIKTLLRNHDRKLYDSWFLSKEPKSLVLGPEALRMLKNESGKILENWKVYLESCEENTNSFYTKKFLKKCIWYPEIPMKLAEESLRKVQEGNPRSLIILALLLQGPEFVRIIEPMMPLSGKMEIEGEGAKKSFRVKNSIPTAINLMNPPPSLELVGRFFQGDYVALGLACLMNVARRISIRKVNDYVKALVDKPISVKKHGIRLMCSVTSNTNLVAEFLEDLWKTEKHKSIREVIFERSYKLLTNQPCKKTWILMKLCIEGFTPEDVECIRKLKKLRIPQEYFPDYFETSLNKIEKLGEEGYDPTLTIKLICSFIRMIDRNENNLSEEYCRVLVRKFGFDLSLDRRIITAGQLYVIRSFLLNAREDKLESRLEFFCDLLTTLITNDWNKPHPENFQFYPARKWLRRIVKNIVYLESEEKPNPVRSKSLINLFSSVLEPGQDAYSFLSLFFLIQFKNAESDTKRFGLLIGQQLPKLIEFFSAEMLFHIANKLYHFTSCVDIDWGTTLVEVLLEMNSTHCAIVAAVLLIKNHRKIPDDEYEDVVKKLRKLNYPAIQFLLNRHNVSVQMSDEYCY